MVDLSKLEKARDIFEDFRINMKNDRDKAGAIQSFEFCYELSWKMMKRILELNGVDEIGSQKDTFRKAVKEKLIDDPEVWFKFQKIRNIASHTYEKENLDLVINIFDVFSKELNKLIKRMKNFI